MLRHLLHIRGRGWSQAGLEPATPGLPNRRNPFLRHLLCHSEATLGEGSELHRRTGDWNRTSDLRIRNPTFFPLRSIPLLRHSLFLSMIFSGGKGRTVQPAFEISSSLADFSPASGCKAGWLLRNVFALLQQTLGGAMVQSLIWWNSATCP